MRYLSVIFSLLSIIIFSKTLCATSAYWASAQGTFSSSRLNEISRFTPKIVYNSLDDNNKESFLKIVNTIRGSLHKVDRKTLEQIKKDRNIYFLYEQLYKNPEEIENFLKFIEEILLNPSKYEIDDTLIFLLNIDLQGFSKKLAYTKKLATEYDSNLNKTRLLHSWNRISKEKVDETYNRLEKIFIHQIEEAYDKGEIIKMISNMDEKFFNNLVSTLKFSLRIFKLDIDSEEMRSSLFYLLYNLAQLKYIISVENFEVIASFWSLSDNDIPSDRLFPKWVSFLESLNRFSLDILKISLSYRVKFSNHHFFRDADYTLWNTYISATTNLTELELNEILSLTENNETWQIQNIFSLGKMNKEERRIFVTFVDENVQKKQSSLIRDLSELPENERARVFSILKELDIADESIIKSLVQLPKENQKQSLVLCKKLDAGLKLKNGINLYNRILEKMEKINPNKWETAINRLIERKPPTKKPSDFYSIPELFVLMAQEDSSY